MRIFFALLLLVGGCAANKSLAKLEHESYMESMAAFYTQCEADGWKSAECQMEDQ